MHASRSLVAATFAAVWQTVSAFPASTGTGTGTSTSAQVVVPRAEPTDLWVTVDDDGKPKTVTPVVTTISGTTSVISPAPNAGSVFTETKYGQVTTRTGTAPAATATGKKGEGSFNACHNKDGAHAPFCRPTPGETLNPGTSYYITWDPSFFNGTNTTVLITGSYFNTTTGEITSQAFESPKTAAGWSFWSFAVSKDLLQGKSAVNISLAIAELAVGKKEGAIHGGPTVTIAHPPAYKPEQPKPPTGPALYIGLPVILGFVVICLVGTCLWNRKSRAVGLGNIMGRGRRGYGVGKSRGQRVRGAFAGGKKGESIRLMDHDDGPAATAPPAQGYRDQPDHFDPARPGQRDDRDFDFGLAGPRVPAGGGGGGGGGGDLARRDSDALGSLAGTPTDETFQGRRGGNAFRDEVSRQDRERI